MSLGHEITNYKSLSLSDIKSIIEYNIKKTFKLFDYTLVTQETQHPWLVKSCKSQVNSVTIPLPLYYPFMVLFFYVYY